MRGHCARMFKLFFFSPYDFEEVIRLVGALIVSYIVVLWRGADVRACG